MKQGKHIYPDGSEGWFQDSKLHRLDGPAYISPGVTEEWYKDGKLHRRDGPAVTRSDGRERWWRDDKRWPAQSREWWERDSESQIRRFLR